jgi:hypothetical protein
MKGLIKFNLMVILSKYHLGRRISAQSPGELIAQQNPDEPVVKQGHWTQKSYAELDKQEDVDLLRVRYLISQ